MAKQPVPLAKRVAAQVGEVGDDLAALRDLAVLLAHRIDRGAFDSDAGMASLSKELRTVLAVIREAQRAKDDDFDRFIASLSAEVRDPKES